MKKNILKITLLLISIIFMLQIKVQATVVVSTDKQVESGSGNVTISVTSKQALGAYKLKLVDTAGLELVNADGGEISSDKKTITGSSATGISNLGSYTFKVPTVTQDTTYNIKFSITGMETSNLEAVSDESNVAKITVKAPVVNNNLGNETNENTNNSQITTSKSSEAYLSNLGINPYDFKGFKSNITQYNVEVPNSVTSVEVYAKAAKNGKVTEKRTVTLKEGENKVEVTVTSEDEKNTKTYTLTIKRKTADEETTENSEARLKNLGIKPEEYDFTGFKSDTMEYSVEVPNEVEQIEIYATAINSNAQITGIGNIELNEGENILPIEVTAKDGTQKTYTIKVTRAKSENEKEITGTTQKFGLSELTVTGFTISPKFSTGVYEYTIGLKEDLESLEIDAKATNNEAKVEIIGNENLKQGENIITIIVKGENTEDVETYQIIVNKNIAIEEKTSWLKPETWGKEEKIKIAIVITIIVLIIIAIILKIKISRQEQEENLPNLPGGDELDKAITEHQELTEDLINDVEEEQQNEDIYQFTQEDTKKEKRKGRHF